MATDYIAAADVDALIGTKTRQALFTDDDAGSSYDSTEFDRACELASIIARAACENAGYTTGTSTTNDMVVVAALAVFLKFAFGRKGQSVPEAFATILDGIPEGVRQGLVPLPGLDPDAYEGVGGVKFTDPSATSSTGKPRIMGGLRKIF